MKSYNADVRNFEPASASWCRNKPFLSNTRGPDPERRINSNNDVYFTYSTEFVWKRLLWRKQNKEDISSTHANRTNFYSTHNAKLGLGHANRASVSRPRTYFGCDHLHYIQTVLGTAMHGAPKNTDYTWTSTKRASECNVSIAQRQGRDTEASNQLKYVKNIKNSARARNRYADNISMYNFKVNMTKRYRTEKTRLQNVSVDFSSCRGQTIAPLDTEMIPDALCVPLDGSCGHEVEQETYGKMPCCRQRLLVSKSHERHFLDYDLAAVELMLQKRLKPT